MCPITGRPDAFGTPGAVPSSAIDATAALEAWARVSRAMIGGSPVERILDLVAQTAADLTGHSSAAVMLLDDDGRRLVARGVTGLKDAYVAGVNEVVPIVVESRATDGEAPSSRAVRTGRVVVADVESDRGLAAYSRLASAQGYTSMAAVPLVTQRGTIGALNVYAAERVTFSASQLTLLEALAMDAAAAIEIVRLRERERRTIEELNQSDLMYQALTTVALADEGLEPIVSALAEMTGRRVSVEEAIGGSLLSAGRPPPADDASVFEDLRRRLLAGSTSRPDGMVPREATTERGERLSVAEVLLGDEVVAHLWAYGKRPMTVAQARVLERGAVLVALELLKQRHAQEVEWRARGDLLDDLLTADPADHGRVLERARTFGHDLARPHVLMVSRPDGAGLGEPSAGSRIDGEAMLRRVVSAAQAVCAGASVSPLIGTRSGFVVMVWPAGRDDSDGPARIAGALQRYLVSHTGITISTCLADASVAPAQLAASFRLASGALRLIQGGGPVHQIVSLDQLGIFRILLAVEDPAALREYADRLLRPLREYDLARQAELMQTLRGYLDHDLNASRAAAALHVHTNTLIYRLRRVEEIAGIRLKSTDDLLQIGLALAIERLGSPTPAS